MTELLKLKYFYIIFLSFIVLTIVTTNKISADQKIRITADEMQIEQEGQIIKAKGKKWQKKIIQWVIPTLIASY